MHKVRNNRRGVTLAEMLIVVAIIIALAAVSAVAVYRYQRGLKQLELDGIAKEIFVAAQNHLTMAESQDYLGLDGEDAFGKKSSLTEDAGKGIYYFVVGASSEDPDSASYASPDTAGAKKTVLSLMLPFASVDETVRLGGSYIIRYQSDPGIVLDVFYAEKNGRYPLTLEKSDYSEELFSTYVGLNNKSRRTYTRDNAVLGWYGGDEAVALPTGTALKQPKITVFNEETLWVKVEDPNSGTPNVGLKLVVTGLTSKQSVPIELDPTSLLSNVALDPDGSFHVTLDDITNSNHFAQLFGSAGLIPGEDIEIYAVAYNNTQITDSSNGKSSVEVTNSIFACDGDGDDLTASIGYIRHLENLEENVSAYDPKSAVSAVQINDLVWTNFFGGTARITDSSGVPIPSGNQAFVPVSPAYSLGYNGEKNSISGVVINTSAAGSGSAGLFGELGSNDSVSDLKLIDFSVTSGSGSAGALAGVSAGKVTNVLAHNSGRGATATVTGTGSVGGLIGSLTGGTVEKSAAALVVSSSGGSAGGLIGSATGGTVSASYSGGHTDGTGEYSNTNFNVTGSTYAGGLIGDAGSADISNCYSTCSARSDTTGTAYAGGLVGSASGTITNCYATGLVSGATEGAFAGSLSGKTENCKYYMIVNEREKVANNPSKGFEYLSPVGSWTAAEKDISALDNDPSSFNRFAQVRAGSSGASPIEAKPYDSTLTSYYGGMYDLQSVSRLGASTVTPSDFVSTHYGDWPSKETWVINTPGGGSGGTTPPAPSGGKHPVNGYFDVSFTGNDSLTHYLHQETLQWRFTLSSAVPAIVEWNQEKGLYFTAPGTATLTFTAGGYTPLTAGETFTVTAEGFVPDPDPVTYSIVLTSSTPTSERHYSITFTNSSDHLMRTRTVTIPMTGTITSVSGSNATITQGANSITVEYTNNGAGIAASGNAVVYLTLKGSGDFGLVLD